MILLFTSLQKKLQRKRTRIPLLKKLLRKEMMRRKRMMRIKKMFPLSKKLQRKKIPLLK